MNANPTIAATTQGDFDFPPQFSVDSISLSGMSITGSMNIVQKPSGLSTDWISATDSDSRLSTSVFSNMIEQAELDVRRQPGRPNALLNLALACLGSGQLAKAKELFERVLEIDGANYLAIANLVKVSLQQGDADKAERLSKAGLDHFHSDPLLSINLAAILTNKGDIQSALNVIRAATDTHPKDPGLQFVLGSLYIAIGDFRAALNFLRQASRRMDRVPQVHQALGVAYALAGQPKESARSFQVSISLDKNTVGAIRGLAQVLFEKGNYERVVKLLTGYVEIHDDELGNDLLAKALLKLDRESEARVILQKTLANVRKTRPGDSWRIAQLLNDIGWCYLAKGDESKADDLFREAIEICETRGHFPFLNLAVLLHRKKSDLEAVAILRRAMKLFPREFSLFTFLSGIEEQRGNYSEALRLDEYVLKLPEAPAEAFAHVSWLLSDWFCELDQAEAVLHTGLGRFPRNKLLSNNLAYVYLLKRETDKAAEVLANFPAEEHDVFLTATSGLLALRKGNVERARQLYTQAFRLASATGDHTLARTAMEKMHLEFARYFLDQGDEASARIELHAGSRIKDGRRAYERDISTLIKSLGDGS